MRHRNLVNHAMEMGKRLGIEAGERMLGYISMSFDAALEEIFPVLLRGGTIVIAENPAELVGTSLLEEDRKRRDQLPAPAGECVAPDRRGDGEEGIERCRRA